VPGALIAVIVATIIATIFGYRLSTSMCLPIYWQRFNFRTRQSNQGISGFAAVKGDNDCDHCQRRSLLSAAAVDRLHHGKRTDFDRELAAQGIGNIICSVLAHCR